MGRSNRAKGSVSMLVLVVLIIALLFIGTPKDQPSQPEPTVAIEVTATPIPTATPTPVPVTATPTPTATADVSIRECDEFERWWLEVEYNVGIYDELAIVTIEYDHQLVTFYMGYLDGDWELICWCFG